MRQAGEKKYAATENEMAVLAALRGRGGPITLRECPSSWAAVFDALAGHELCWFDYEHFEVDNNRRRIKVRRYHAYEPDFYAGIEFNVSRSDRKIKKFK